MAAAVPWGPKVKSWFPKVVASQSSIARSRSSPPRLASCGRESGAHGEIPGIQNQDRTQSLRRGLAFGNFGRQTREPATRVVIIQSKRGLVIHRCHADEVRMQVIRVKNREGLFTCRLSRQRLDNGDRGSCLRKKSPALHSIGNHVFHGGRDF